jgi:DNA polymerase elongation subunit (family B)
MEDDSKSKLYVEITEFFTDDMIYTHKKEPFVKTKVKDDENDDGDGDGDGVYEEGDDEDLPETIASLEKLSEKNPAKPYTIFMFGRTQKFGGKTVSVEVVGFHPEFFIELPTVMSLLSTVIPFDTLSEEMIHEYGLHKHAEYLLWKKSVTWSTPAFQAKALLEWIKGKLYGSSKECVFGELVYYKAMDGFDFGRDRPMLRLSFTKVLTMKSVLKMFTYYENGVRCPTPLFIRGVTPPNATQGFPFRIYNSIIDPLNQFLHRRHIDPSSWIECRGPLTIVRAPKDVREELCEAKKKLATSSEETTTDIHIIVHADQVFPPSEPEALTGLTQRIVLTYDLECRSHLGGFPVPKNNYRTFASDMLTLWRMLCAGQPPLAWHETPAAKSLLVEYKTKPMLFVKHALQIGYSNALPPEISSLNGVDRNAHFGDIRKIYTCEKRTPTIEKILKTVKALTLLFKDITTLFQSGTKITEDYKRYVGQVQNILDRYLPKVAGDEIIQISMCFSRSDQAIPFLNYMLVWGSCDPIPDCTVIECQTEKELLLKFKELMYNHDPDIITGYNINRFDTPWLVHRAAELRIDDEFMKLGRFKHFRSELKSRMVKFQKDLEEVEYIIIPGRVQLDILESVKQDINIKLEKNSLDTVISEYINGDVKESRYNEETNETIFETNTVSGLRPGNNIEILRIQGFMRCSYEEGKKLEITRIERQSPNASIYYISVKGNHDFFKTQRSLDRDMLAELPESVHSANTPNYQWRLGKNDMTPDRIFSLHMGSSRDRAEIAKYCLVDSQLCVLLLRKFKYITNAACISNACKVPFTMILSRGMNIRNTNVFLYHSRQHGKLYLLNSKERTSEGYEGAIVLRPKVGMYLTSPVTVLDFASLYPSSMRELNISYETLVTDPWLCGPDGERFLNALGYDVKDVEFDTFDYPEGMDQDASNTKKKASRVVSGKRVCRFIQNSGPHSRGEYRGMLASLEDYLVSNRSFQRKKAKQVRITLASGQVFIGLYDPKRHCIDVERKDNSMKYDLISLNPTDHVVECEDVYDDMGKQTLDSLQLAIKMTANAVYGGLGGPTSPLFCLEIAASITAIGRMRLGDAINYVMNPKNYPQVMASGETRYLKNEIVYGDTDSVFVLFELIDEFGNKLEGIVARKRAIELGDMTQAGMEHILNKPQELENEKTADPLILIRAKGYASVFYERDPYKGKLKFQGIVLKRRDNAMIVKIVFSTVLSCIMNHGTVRQAEELLQKLLFRLINSDIRGNRANGLLHFRDSKDSFGIETLIITKQLGVDYKNPESSATFVLAHRMGERDPGNKPRPGDRIPYVHFDVNMLSTPPVPTFASSSTSNAKRSKGVMGVSGSGAGNLLQGDKIEHPDYIMSHPEYVPDYEYYLSNQLCHPIAQLFALRLEELKAYENFVKTSFHVDPIGQLYKETKMSAEKGSWTQDRFDEEFMKKKIKLTGDLLFEPVLNRVREMRGNSKSSSSYKHSSTSTLRRINPGQSRITTFFDAPAKRKIDSMSDSNCCFMQEDNDE